MSAEGVGGSGALVRVCWAYLHKNCPVANGFLLLPCERCNNAQGRQIMIIGKLPLLQVLSADPRHRCKRVQLRLSKVQQAMHEVHKRGTVHSGIWTYSHCRINLRRVSGLRLRWSFKRCAGHLKLLTAAEANTIWRFEIKRTKLAVTKQL